MTNSWATRQCLTSWTSPWTEPKVNSGRLGFFVQDEPIPEHAASAPSVPEQDEDLHNLFAEEFEDTFQFAPVKSAKPQQPVKQP